jgi:hypothetical protein
MGKIYRIRHWRYLLINGLVRVFKINWKHNKWVKAQGLINWKGYKNSNLNHQLKA